MYRGKCRRKNGELEFDDKMLDIALKAWGMNNKRYIGLY
jgi:hypothetical protein